MTAPAAAQELSREELIVEVEMLLRGGEWAGRIAARLGYRPESLVRRLYRADRADLARRIDDATRTLA